MYRFSQASKEKSKKVKSTEGEIHDLICLRSPLNRHIWDLALQSRKSSADAFENVR